MPNNPLSRRGRLERLHAARGPNRGPGRLQRLVRPSRFLDSEKSRSSLLLGSARSSIRLPALRGPTLVVAAEIRYFLYKSRQLTPLPRFRLRYPLRAAEHYHHRRAVAERGYAAEQRQGPLRAHLESDNSGPLSTEERTDEHGDGRKYHSHAGKDRDELADGQKEPFSPVAPKGPIGRRPSTAGAGRGQRTHGAAARATDAHFRPPLAERAELSGSADCGFRIVVRDATAVPDPRPSAESAVATGSATVPAPQHRHPGGGPARRRPGRGRTKPPRTREPRRRPADSRGGGSWQR